MSICWCFLLFFWADLQFLYSISPYLPLGVSHQSLWWLRCIRVDQLGSVNWSGSVGLTGRLTDYWTGVSCLLSHRTAVVAMLGLGITGDGEVMDASLVCRLAEKGINIFFYFFFYVIDQLALHFGSILLFDVEPLQSLRSELKRSIPTALFYYPHSCKQF